MLLSFNTIYTHCHIRRRVKYEAITGSLIDCGPEALGKHLKFPSCNRVFRCTLKWCRITMRKSNGGGGWDCKWHPLWWKVKTGFNTSHTDCNLKEAESPKRFMGGMNLAVRPLVTLLVSVKETTWRVLNHCRTNTALFKVFSWQEEKRKEKRRDASSVSGPFISSWAER